MTSEPLPGLDRLLEHRAWLRAVARVLVRDDSAADDLAQDVWLDALRAGDVRPQSPRGWLARILRRNASDAGRGDRRRAAREALAARPEASVSDPAALAAEAEGLRLVADAVLALDEPYRGTVLLRWFEGLSPPEVAARQGVPLETVRTRLRRGLAMLRDRLDRDRGGRRAWMALLVPFGEAAPTPRRVLPRRRVAAALVATAAVAIAVVVAAEAPTDGPDAAVGTRPSPTAGRPRPTSAAPDADPRRKRARASISAEADRAGEGSTAIDPWLTVYVIDEEGNAVAGADVRVEFADPGPDATAEARAELARCGGVRRAIGAGPFVLEDLPAIASGLEVTVSATAAGRVPSQRVTVPLDAERSPSTRLVLGVARTQAVRVLDAVSRQPIAGALVVSTTECARRGIDVSAIAEPAGDGWATTGADGAARIGGLGRGGHTYVVRAPAYIPRSAERAITDVCEFLLDPVGVPASIRVVAGLPDGRPAAGARIFVSLQDRIDAPPFAARADANGVALVTGLPAGMCIVSADVRDVPPVLPGGATSRGFRWFGAVRPALARPGEEVRVRLGASLTRASVAVRVLDRAGRPIAGVPVEFDGPFGTRLASDADGLVVLEGLDPGDEMSADLRGERRMLVASTGATPIDWVADVARLSGRVTLGDGAPAEGRATVALLEGERQRIVGVHRDGTFEVFVAPGRAVLMAWGTEGRIALASYDVPEGGGSAEVRLVRGGTLRITGLAADDTAAVEVGESGRRPLYASRKANGRTVALPPGAWTVSGTAGGRTFRRTVEIREAEETVLDASAN